MRPFSLTVVCVGAMLVTSWLSADPVVPVVPGSVQEQRLDLPSTDADVAQIFEQLQGNEGKDDEVSEASLQWLLRRQGAEKLSYFHTESVRFDVAGVTNVTLRNETWRLVECEYLSRIADRSRGTEYRARWKVAYVFDAKGTLRDWVDDYDVALLRDINADGDVELVAYIDSPKRVIVYSYERGSRELLRVDGVPEHGEFLESNPGKEGGQYITYEKPVAIIADNAAPVACLKLAQHGLYKWDAKQQRYVNERWTRLMWVKPPHNQPKDGPGRRYSFS
jgi:hypothetical protein